MTALAASAVAGPLHRVVEWIDAHVSPVVLLEIRRAMRSKALQVVFAVLLVVGGFAVFIAADSPQGGSDEALTTLLTGLAVACIGIIPLQAGFAWSSDRQGGAGAAVAMTGMTSRAMLAGRLVTAWVHVAFVLSALGPFLLAVAAIGDVSAIGLALGVGMILVGQPLAMTATLLVASFEARGGLQGLRNAALLQTAAGMTLLASVVAVVLADDPDELATRDGRLLASLGLWACFTLPPALFALAVERAEPGRVHPQRRARAWLVLHALGLPLLPLLVTRVRSNDFVLYGMWLVLGAGLLLTLSLTDPPPGRRFTPSLFHPGERRVRWLTIACVFPVILALGVQVDPSGRPPGAALLLTAQLAGIASLPIALRPVIHPSFWTPFAQRVTLLATFVGTLFLPAGGRHGPVPEVLIGLSPTAGFSLLADSANWLTRSPWLPLGGFAWLCVFVLAEFVLADESQRREVVP